MEGYLRTGFGSFLTANRVYSSILTKIEIAKKELQILTIGITN